MNELGESGSHHRMFPTFDITSDYTPTFEMIFDDEFVLQKSIESKFPISPCTFFDSNRLVLSYLFMFAAQGEDTTGVCFLNFIINSYILSIDCILNFIFDGSFILSTFS